MMNKEELKYNLSQFMGTERYYRHSFKCLLTDGVKYLADKAECYWLIDIIDSLVPKMIREEKSFYVAEIKVDEEETGHFSLTDGDYNLLYKQEIPYTDFPFESYKLFISIVYLNIDKPEMVIMLTSEY